MSHLYLQKKQPKSSMCLILLIINGMLFLPEKDVLLELKIADKEEYNYYDEIPLFSIGMESLAVDDEGNETNYMRLDHEEGLW